MNRMSSLRSVAVALAALAFAGCSSTATKTDEGDGAPVSDVGSAALAAGAGGDWAGNPLNNPNSPLYNKVIYFEYDSTEIRPEYRDVIRAHAQYLAANPSLTVRLEGHADERGSREYNIALGQRRADTVNRLMSVEGAAGAQMITVSYGEERPASFGQSEESWSLNRRVELVY